MSESSRVGSLSVEICATLLTDKPPVLPLREEHNSLGFEVIYNGYGVGEKTSQYEAKRAVEMFRKAEEEREKNKIRLFPRSKRRIREKLEQRKKIEKELEMPHAFSYESVDRVLQDASTTSSSGTSLSYSSSSEDSVGRKGKRVPAWKRFFRKVRSVDDSMMPSSVKVVKLKEASSFENVFNSVDFDDIFKEADRPIRQTRSAGETLASTVFSGSVEFSAHLPPKEPRVEEMEIQFVHMHPTETSDPKTTEDKSLDSNVKEAFKGVDLDAKGSVKVVHEPPKLTPEEIKKAFLDSLPTISTGIQSDYGSMVPQPGGAAAKDKKSPTSTAQHMPNNPFDTIEHDVFAELDKVAAQNATKVETGASSNPFDRQESSELVVKAVNTTDIVPFGCFGNDDKGSAEEKDEPAESDEKGNTQHVDGWFSSAKHALEHMAGEVFLTNYTEAHQKKADTTDFPDIPLVGSAAMKTIPSPKASPSEQEDLLELAISFGSTNQLSVALASLVTPDEDIEKLVVAHPELVQIKNMEDGRLPLHSLCSRGLPNRSMVQAETLTDYLVQDIRSYKKLLDLVVFSFPVARTVVDKNGDLPLHLLARTLMEWEAVWYEAVYDQASKEGDPNGKTAVAISELYHNMSDAMEVQLEAIPPIPSLCRKPGSVGTILPLHAACIFTSSVNTLRLLLAAYPGATEIPCDVGRLQTFVPDKSKALELHEGLSTDFPKWEVEAKHESNPSISWSQAQHGERDPDNWVRRSDLLFAYNPSIEPYRFEKARIRRFETRIMSEAALLAEGKIAKLSDHSRLLWVWMCTFREEKTMRPTYVKSVQRIVDDVSIRALKILASVRVDNGTLLVDAANPQCASIIRERLGDEMIGERVRPKEGKRTLWSTSTLMLDERQLLALSCRRIFNINEEGLPTSFLILPYHLERDDNGELKASAGNESCDSKFVDYFLRLTEPRSIAYYLDQKSSRIYGRSLFEFADEQDELSNEFAKVREVEASLLGLYMTHGAYFYLLDESKGLPIVPPREDKLYPFKLMDPSTIVPKLLPMMLASMILLRGERAMSILIDVLLDKKTTLIPPSWIEASKEISAYLDSDDALHGSSTATFDYRQKEELKHFPNAAEYRKRSSNTPEGVQEWNVEVSILDMLINTNDPKRLLCGLEPHFIAGKGVFWRRDTIEQCRRQMKPKDRTTKVEQARMKKEGPIPDIHELSMKHEALAMKNRILRQDSGCLSDVSPLGFPQPENDSGDEELRLHHPTEIFSSSDEEANVLYQHHSEEIMSADGIPVIHIREDRDDDSSAHDAIIRSRRLLEDLRREVEQKSYSFSNNGVTQMRSLTEKHALLFEHLGLKLPDVEMELSKDTTSNENVSLQVYEELVGQLDNSKVWVEDSQVIRLKFLLAQEAKRAALLCRRVQTVEREKKLLFSRDRERRGIIDQPIELESTIRDGSSLSKARKLLLRMCDLEDRLLVNEISMQHLKLEAQTLEQKIEMVRDGEYWYDEEEEKLFRHDSPVQGNVSEVTDDEAFDFDEFQLLNIDELSGASGQSPFKLVPVVDWIKFYPSSGRIEV